jgi:hypothetical protein
VQEPTGTTNMDFEFNQSSTLSSNGVTPVRTGGDLLIQYDLAQGGTIPQLFLSTWLTQEYVDDQNEANDPDPYTGNPAEDCEASNSYPCWSDKEDLSGQGLATGSINTTAITDTNAPGDPTDGLATGGSIGPRTFGEAQIDFDAIVGGSEDGCVSFGSAYLKSRSSDSFTSAIKDFIAPATLNLNNCATVIIRKETVPDGATETFRFDHILNTDPALEDDDTTAGIDESSQFDLQDGDNFTNNDVLQGTGYTVTEDPANLPAGWDLTTIDCTASNLGEDENGDPVPDPTGNTSTGIVTFDIDSNDDLVDCTYTNEQAVTTIDTEQKVFPNDKATISGTGGSGTPTGTVKFELFGPDTPGSTTDDGCTGTADYTQDLVPLTNGVANTTNGDGAVPEFAINASNDGLYWWQVTYTPDAASNFPAAVSCVENTDVAIEDAPPEPTP